MRKALIILGMFCLSIHLNGQAIEGRILDSLRNMPLEYVSIGIINTRYGTITDQKGEFGLELQEVEPESMVRISMIGYKSQFFTLEELLNRNKVIKLVVEPFPIEEVTVKPFGEPYEIGTTRYTRLGNWCGWGGSRFGKGHEIGTRLELGDNPVHIRKLHVHVHRQAYDTSWYRLHIRDLKGGKPYRELLTSNIVVAIMEESGWVELNLDKYNIVVQGEVALTLEWLKVRGINEDRAMKINDRVTSEYVLLNTKKNQGCIYTKWGVEGKWETGNRGSPAIYLTVQQ